MPEDLKFTHDEVRTMWSRMLLNGFFLKEQENDGNFVTAEDCSLICDNAFRMIKAMDEHGLCRE